MLAVGVSVFYVAGVAVAGVVRGVVAGLFFALIILKSSSGSGGMFNNVLPDPCPDVLAISLNCNRHTSAKGVLKLNIQIILTPWNMTVVLDVMRSFCGVFA